MSIDKDFEVEKRVVESLYQIFFFYFFSKVGNVFIDKNEGGLDRCGGLKRFRIKIDC